MHAEPWTVSGREEGELEAVRGSGATSPTSDFRDCRQVTLLPQVPSRKTAAAALHRPGAVPFSGSGRLATPSVVGQQDSALGPQLTRPDLTWTGCNTVRGPRCGQTSSGAVRRRPSPCAGTCPKNAADCASSKTIAVSPAHFTVTAERAGWKASEAV